MPKLHQSRMLKEEFQAANHTRHMDVIWDRTESGAGRFEGLVMSCVREAMTRICGEPVEIRRDQLQTRPCRSAALLTVKTQAISGTVLCVVHDSRQSPALLLNELSAALTAELASHSISVNEHQMRLVHLDDMRIASKALASTPCLLQSRTENTEVAVAYVEVDKPIAEVEIQGDNMFRIPLTDIHTDIQVGFDVYLFLPANRKYLRYLKVGSRLTARQVSGLTARRVSHFFVQEADLEAYQRYHVTRAVAESCAA